MSKQAKKNKGKTAQKDVGKPKSHLWLILILGFIVGAAGIGLGLYGYFSWTEIPNALNSVGDTGETTGGTEPPGNRQPAWLSLSAGSFTAAGALIAAWLIFHRGELDRSSREELEREQRSHQAELDREQREHQAKLESDRRELEWRKAREESRNQRREGFGTRMSTAIEHLGSANVTTQCAGMIELGSIADDWAALSREISKDKSTDFDKSATRVQEEATRRQQEIIDLIFKRPFPEPDTAVNTDVDPRVETRTSLLRAHLADVDGTLPLHSWASFDFSNAELSRVDLPQLDLSEMRFFNADLSETNLDGTNLTGAKLTRANLSGANLTRANLTRANLNNANLKEAKLWKAKLNQSRLDEADLSKANMIEADLNEARIIGADLTEADLRHADLSEAGITFAKSLEGANFSLATKFPDSFDPRQRGMLPKNP